MCKFQIYNMIINFMLYLIAKGIPLQLEYTEWYHTTNRIRSEDSKLDVYHLCQTSNLYDDKLHT